MKRLTLLLGILLIVILMVWIAYVGFTTKITFNANNAFSISVSGFGSIGLDTKDKTKINTVINYLESIRCVKNTKREAHNQSPDATVFLMM